MRRTWHVLGTLALSLAAGCEPSRGWVEVGLREDALVEAPPPALLDTSMARAALAPRPAGPLAGPRAPRPAPGAGAGGGGRGARAASRHRAGAGAFVLPGAGRRRRRRRAAGSRGRAAGDGGSGSRRPDAVGHPR